MSTRFAKEPNTAKSRWKCLKNHCFGCYFFWKYNFKKVLEIFLFSSSRSSNSSFIVPGIIVRPTFTFEVIFVQGEGDASLTFPSVFAPTLFTDKVLLLNLWFKLLCQNLSWLWLCRFISKTFVFFLWSTHLFCLPFCFHYYDSVS